MITYNSQVNKNRIKKPVPQNKQDFQFTDWSTHTIKAILDNPVYTGYIVFGRRRTVESVNCETGEMVLFGRLDDAASVTLNDAVSV